MIKQTEEGKKLTTAKNTIFADKQLIQCVYVCLRIMHIRVYKVYVYICIYTQYLGHKVDLRKLSLFVQSIGNGMKIP